MAHRCFTTFQAMILIWIMWSFRRMAFMRSRQRRGANLPSAQVVVDGDTLTVAGQVPARNPIVQVTAAADWLEKLLRESTNKRFLVRGVVVFPGWYMEQKEPRGNVWVIEPKMLPGLIERAPVMIAPSD